MKDTPLRACTVRSPRVRFSSEAPVPVARRPAACTRYSTCTSSTTTTGFLPPGDGIDSFNLSPVSVNPAITLLSRPEEQDSGHEHRHGPDGEIQPVDRRVRDIWHQQSAGDGKHLVDPSVKEKPPRPQ